MKEKLLKFLSVKVYVFTLMVILAILRVPEEYFAKLIWLAAGFFAVRMFQYWLYEKK